MKKNILHWNKITRVVIFCFIILTTTSVDASDSYYAKLTTSVSPIGAGTVYIDDEQVPSKEKKTDNANENATFKVKAAPSDLYNFVSWSCNPQTDGVCSIKDEINNSTTITAQSGPKGSSATTAETMIRSYNVTAQFKRKNIIFNTPAIPSFPAITWKNPTVEGTINIPVENVKDIKDFTAPTDFTDNLTDVKLFDITNNNLKINATYKLPEDGDNSIGFTVKAKPKGEPEGTGDGDESYLKYTLIIPDVDYTPEFSLTNLSFPETTQGSPIDMSITPYDYGDLPIGKKDTNDEYYVTWDPVIEDNSNFSIKSIDQTTGVCTITYHPTNQGEHSTSLSLTATYKNTKGSWESNPVNCILSGKCQEDQEPEFEIRQNDVAVTSMLYEFDMDGVQESLFNIHTVGVADVSLSTTGSDAVQAILANDKKTFTVTTITPPTAGDYTNVFTLTGTQMLGSQKGEQINAPISITIRRWYEPINFIANPGQTSVQLSWKDTQFATQYILLKDGNRIASLTNDITTFTDDSCLPNTDYTYTLQVVLKNGDIYYDTKEEVIHTHTLTSGSSTAPGGLSILTLGNCPTLKSSTNVDATGAFAADGEALMEELYIMDKKDSTKCHIFKKESSTPQYYYTYSKTIDPTSTEGRVGRITNKKIYIAGTCESLFWNTGDKMGWMQPVNCDIYLDNARLGTSYSRTLTTICNAPINGLDRSKELTFDVKIPASAAVFYLPDANGDSNTTKIHLKGKNYLGGNMAGLCYIALVVDLGRIASAQTVANYYPNYSPAIAIKDNAAFYNTNRTDVTTAIDWTTNPTIPDITCHFDTKWANNETQTDGYLDISTRPCQNPDSVYNNTKSPNLHHPEQTYIENGRYTTYLYWIHFYGLRYASPLETGGQHGHFVIDGGHINLWPANGHTRDIQYHNISGGMIAIVVASGKHTNYLTCGARRWDIKAGKEAFDGSGTFTIQTKEKESECGLAVQTVLQAECLADALNDFPTVPVASLYGGGKGLPLGFLTINGGTISANTDENSFAYHWQDWDYTNKKAINNTAKNIADDGSNQPLFGPNVIINGGTFLTPIYGTTNIGNGTGLKNTGKWNNEGVKDFSSSDFKTKNLHNQSVSRTTISMPAAGTDYSDYANSITEVPNRNTGYIVNAGSEKDYQYGMMNVWSDADKKCYFYLPCTDGLCLDKYKSYWVENNQELKQFDTDTYIYNLVVDSGGSISVADDYRVHGRPYYRSGFKEGYYHTISMPFTVDQFSVLDPDDDYEEVTFTSWVDSKDDANADNSRAYFYLYHLNDATGAQRTTGVNDEFRNNYHTHTDGTSMKQGKTYILKFLESGGYWEENPIIFRGTKNQTIKGKSSFSFATRPTNDLEFVMDGNTTFATQDISDYGEIYLVDPDTWGDDAFHVTTASTLAPMQGCLVGSTTTMQHYRIIGREGKVEQTALDQLIHTGWTAVGAHQAMLIMTPQDATAHIYTAESKLWKTVSLTANTGVIINAPAGFYIVHAGNDSKKVLVQ